MRGSSRVKVKWCAGMLAVGLAASGCGADKSGDGGDGPAGGTFRFGLIEPATIDPALAAETPGLVSAEVLFTGMYRVGPEGQMVPKLAESATPNAGCTQWTFKIKGGTKFTNGEPVDAAAFVRGWSRAAGKAMASDVAYHLGGIKGFQELQDGKTTAFSGLKAVDATTLQVDLTAGDCEFDKKTSHTVFSPMPKAAGTGPNKKFQEAPIGNGPFKMQGKWQHNKLITLVRNDDYGLEKAKLGKVEIYLLNPTSMFDLEYQGFQTGQFDYAHVPTPQLKTAEAKYKPRGEWIRKETNGMNYLLPITDRGPLKSKDARLAISYAIDRSLISKSVYQGFQKPSSSLVPAALPTSYQPGICASCLKQDPAKAKAHAKAAGLEPGDPLKLTFNAGAGHEDWIQAAGKQIEEVLGLDVEIEGLPSKQVFEGEQSPDATGLFRYSWGADYPTPDSYLYPLLDSASINRGADGSVVGDNRARYSNPAFDALIGKARATTDEKQRIAIYKQAEKVAMDDMALIPTFTRTEYRVVRTDRFDGLDDINFGETPNLENISLKK
ncbi:peptide/nickel transport system substrate-binding protein/oligopeptide transport system substrate-binding protein [Streptomyces sp. SLBN-115]|nr:peptide/nickel transport system substrate-binding protein/oligopeptide transport system substrate-binding protein [Streptomyces sp. SLBN-115]